MWLKPELLKIVEAEKADQQARQQRMQQLYSELGMRNGEEFGAWSINFKYESHKNVKDLRTMVRTLIECVKDSTKQAKLNHTDDTIISSSQQDATKKNLLGQQSTIGNKRTASSMKK